MPKGSPIAYTQAQLDFIKSNCTLTRKDLTDLVNEKFNTNFSSDQILGLCKRNKWRTGRTGRFDKNHPSWNKGTKGICKKNITSFKKGSVPINKKPIGYERICSKDGYVYVKIAEPNVFKAKHRIIWEQHHGSIHDSDVISFKNLDRTDCRIENLILMRKAEMSVYCRKFSTKANSDNNLSYLLVTKLKHAIKTAEKDKELN